MKKILLLFYLFFVFCLLLFINLYYLEGIPHVPDSVAYLFMAKMYASGNLVSSIPISPEHFDFFPGILSVEKGNWLFQYPFGHPLLLTLGVLLGFPNVIPPLTATLSVFLLYKIAQKMFDYKTALFILFLPLLSPFFLENSASFMSHPTALFYLLLSFYFLINAKEKKTFLFLFLSGIFLGLLFNTRPLTCIPFFFAWIFLIGYLYGGYKKIKHYASFAAGFGILMVLFLLFNYFTIGSFFGSQYYSSNTSLFIPTEPTIQEYFKNRLNNALTLFTNFGAMLFGWPMLLTYFLIIFPLLTNKRSRWDLINFSMLLIEPIPYFFCIGTFIMYGPRYWYEILPFAFLLIAHSFSIFYDFKKKLTIAIFTLLSLISILTITGLIPSKDPDFFSPLVLERLKGFNFTDNRIKKTLEKNHIVNGIIFIKDCNGNWWCFGSVFSQNSPTLGTSLIFAKDLGQDNKKLLNFFPEKPAYTINYDTLELSRIR